MNGVDSLSQWGGLHPPENLDLNTRNQLEFFPVEQSGTKAYQPAHCPQLHSEAVSPFSPCYLVIDVAYLKDCFKP